MSQCLNCALSSVSLTVPRLPTRTEDEGKLPSASLTVPRLPARTEGEGKPVLPAMTEDERKFPSTSIFPLALKEINKLPSVLLRQLPISWQNMQQ